MNNDNDKAAACVEAFKPLADAAQRTLTQKEANRLGDGAAFPIPMFLSPNGDYCHAGQYFDGDGMDRRTYIATAALKGLLAGQYRDDGKWNLSDVPREAVKIADALLLALSSSPPATREGAGREGATGGAGEAK